MLNYLKVSKSMLKYVKVCLSMLNKVWESLRKYKKVWDSIRKILWERVLKFQKEQKVFESTNLTLIFFEFEWVVKCRAKTSLSCNPKYTFTTLIIEKFQKLQQFIQNLPYLKHIATTAPYSDHVLLVSLVQTGHKVFQLFSPWPCD